MEPLLKIAREDFENVYRLKKKSCLIVQRIWELGFVESKVEKGKNVRKIGINMKGKFKLAVEILEEKKIQIGDINFRGFQSFSGNEQLF